MSRETWYRAALAALVLWGAWQWWQQRPVRTAAGIQVSQAPIQTEIVNPQAIAYREFTLHPRARWVSEGRVLSTARYRFDATAAIAPMDVAIGWQRMSDQAILSQMKLEQHGRFLFWSSRQPPLPADEITKSVANIHVIPANTLIKRRLNRLRPGQRITLRGYLVDVSHPSGLTLQTSLSRTDSGAGACEVLYVEQLVMN